MNYKGKINRDEIVELVGNIGVEIATDEYQGKINDITSIDSFQWHKDSR